MIFLLTFKQGCLCASLRSDIMEDEYHPNQVTGTVPDRGGTIFDRDFKPISGDENRVIRKADNAALQQHSFHDVFSRLAGLLVKDLEHALNWLPHRLFRLPAGQMCANRVQECDPAGGVGCNSSSACLRSMISC